jgi:conjugative relaxase-like TrwC/TraI family protein
MAADHLYLAAERAALTHRLGVRFGPVDERSGAAEIQGLDDRTLIERFSKRSEQIDHWLDTHGLSGIKASSAAAVATRAPKDYAESEASVYQRWTHELAEQGWTNASWPRCARVDAVVRPAGQNWTPPWMRWLARTD